MLSIAGVCVLLANSGALCPFAFFALALFQRRLLRPVKLPAHVDYARCYARVGSSRDSQANCQGVASLGA